MKILSLLIAFISVSHYVHTQEYLPFADSNAVWINHHVDYEIVDPDPFPIIVSEHYTKYCAPGEDTLINDITYSKIYYCNGPYNAALRQEMGKVYVIPNDSINELLIYDFTAEVGNELDVYSKDYDEHWDLYPAYVYEVDSVLINNVYRIRIGLEGSFWIEGIGNTYGLFNESWINVSNFYNELYCMSDNDTTLYPDFQSTPCQLSVGVEDVEAEKQLINVYPNPSKNHFAIELNDLSKIELLSLYNSMGKEYYLDYTLNEKSIEINLEAYPDGLYFLKMNINGLIISEKLLKVSK